MQSRILVKEALIIPKLEILPTSHTILTSILHTPRRIWETNILVEEISSITLNTHSIIVLHTLVIHPLTLSVVVDKVIILACQTVPSIRGSLQTAIFSLLALSTAHYHESISTELAITIHIVLQTTRFVLCTIQPLSQMVSWRTPNTGSTLLIRTEWDGTCS